MKDTIHSLEIAPCHPAAACLPACAACLHRSWPSSLFGSFVGGGCERAVLLLVPFLPAALYSTSSVSTVAGRDWEIDHQQPGDCGSRHLLPLTGTAAIPEDLPDAPRVLRNFGS